MSETSEAMDEATQVVDQVLVKKPPGELFLFLILTHSEGDHLAMDDTNFIG